MRPALAMGGLLLLAAACDNDQTLVIPDRWITEEFFQDPAQKVDILIVMDNSCSMLAEQEKMGQEFEAFVEFFYVANTDYHIGITTTDMDSDGERGRLVGQVPVITRNTIDAGLAFQQNILVGTDGSGFEQGLEAARTALSPAMLAGPNAGFLRDEADLSVILVSDEDDASPGPVSSYLHDFFEIKGQRERDAFQASVLVGVDPVTGEPAACGKDPEDLFAGADDAPRYVDVARRSGGLARSICSDDFAGVVNEMGLAASRLSYRFELSETPDPDEAVEVTIFIPGTPEFLQDGTPLPPSGIDGGRFAWTLETDGQVWAIRFLDMNDLPPIGSRFLVRYKWDL